MADKEKSLDTTVKVDIQNPCSHDVLVHDANHKPVTVKAGTTSYGVSLQVADVKRFRKAELVEKKRGKKFISITEAGSGQPPAPPQT